MVDPIDAVSAKVNSGYVTETPAIEPASLRAERQADATQLKPVEAAEKPADAAPRETTPRPGIEVHLDGATLHLYSEMRDPDTRRVMLRIPAGYQPKSEPPGDYEPTELKT